MTLNSFLKLSKKYGMEKILIAAILLAAGGYTKQILDRVVAENGELKQVLLKQIESQKEEIVLLRDKLDGNPRNKSDEILKDYERNIYISKELKNLLCNQFIMADRVAFVEAHNTQTGFSEAPFIFYSERFEEVRAGISIERDSFQGVSTTIFTEWQGNFLKHYPISNCVKRINDASLKHFFLKRGTLHVIAYPVFTQDEKILVGFVMAEFTNQHITAPEIIVNLLKNCAVALRAACKK